MNPTTLFLCGDAMTGRGIDQILGHPSEPTLHEVQVRDARRYVRMAEEKHGRIPIPCGPEYPWGESLPVLAAINPDVRIMNLETSVTTRNDWCHGKEIHYRMHPANISCLRAAAIDVAALANNHTLDWGVLGLLETVDCLEAAGIRPAGAGRDLAAACAPAVVRGRDGGRFVVLAAGSATSGIPKFWRADLSRPGINLLHDLSDATADTLSRSFAAASGDGDIRVLSIHWGSNWGYEIPAEFRRFAHRLIDAGHVDIVHGHSSHHARPLEVYRGKLILYGCGDFLSDYEGIGGYERYRGDLVCMFFPTIDRRTGNLIRLRIIPLTSEKFRLVRVNAEDFAWLANALTRTSAQFGSVLKTEPEGTLVLEP